MRLAIITLILLSRANAFNVVAQTKDCEVKVEGYIYDITSNKPIPFATVQIKALSKGVVADENGYFIITGLCKGEIDLIFGHIGYKTAIHHHDDFHEIPNIFLAPENVVLESVVIESKSTSGNLSSSTVSKLSPKELARTQSESLGDVASQIAGVSTISTGQNVVKPVIHGLHSNRILVINNGLRHEFQNWGTDHAPEIDPSLAEQVEVIKGAATVRYGPEALGGVILINPAKIELTSHLHGDLRLVGKSNGRSGEGTLKLQKGFKYFGLMAESSWLKQGDLHTPDYNLTNTGKAEQSLAAGLRIHPLKQLDIEVYYSNFDQELGIIRGGVNGNLNDLLTALKSEIPNDTQPFTYAITTPRQEITHDLLKAQATYSDQNQSISFQFGYQVNHRQEFDVRRGNNNEIPNINLELITNSFDLDWDHPELTIGKGRLFGKLGFQLTDQDNENIPGTNTIPFIPNYNTKRWGLFLIEALEVGKTTYELGVRYDNQKTKIVGRDRQNDVFRDNIGYENVTATIGINKKLSEYTVIRSNFGTAWRPPSVAELYRFGRHLTFIEYGLWRYRVTENDQISTLNVLTNEEKPIPSEIGFKWINTLEKAHNNYQWELTGYVNYIKDFIFTKPAGVTRTVRGTSPFFIYDQGDALFWGVDASAGITHSNKLASTIKVSYLWSKQVDKNDNFVGQPPANLQYNLSIKPILSFFEQTEIQFGLDYTFKQIQVPRVIPVDDLLNAKSLGIELFSNDARNFDIIAPPSGYLLTNVSWRSSIKQFEFNFQIKNLLNVDYRNYTDRIRYFADDIGRNFILTMAYKL